MEAIVKITGIGA
jgi:hypothetical protein